MVNERTSNIRTLSSRLNSLHSATYFSEAMGREYAKHGIEAGLPANMAARSAPLGRVNPGVVTATFYNYSPSFVASIVPAVWDTVSPETMVQARFDGVAVFLHEIYGAREDIALLDDAAGDLATSLSPVLDAMDFSGRALAAANFDVMKKHQPNTSFEALWDVATVAREFRGDGHVASLVATGMPGIDALLLDVATGASFKPRAAQRTRGYSDEEWTTAQARLAESELITVETDERGFDLPVITEAGRDLKAQVEELTDGTVAAAWSALDDEQIAALVPPSRTLIKVLAQSGAFPAKIFASPAKKTQ